MTLILGTLILADLLLCCIFMFADIHEEAQWQTRAAEHDALLDQLWDENE
jgi:hypothetical protein